MSHVNLSDLRVKSPNLSVPSPYNITTAEVIVILLTRYHHESFCQVFGVPQKNCEQFLKHKHWGNNCWNKDTATFGGNDPTSIHKSGKGLSTYSYIQITLVSCMTRDSVMAQV